MSHLERVVVLVDMDCFYCQVEEKHDPSLKGKPIAVVQYNEWKGGGIIAVNYAARDQGVTRNMRGDEAKEKCPDIELCRVPNPRGKADLTKYREAGKDVIMVLQKFTNLIQRASIDEAYLDITKAVLKRMSVQTDPITEAALSNTFIVGYEINEFIESVYHDDINSTHNLKLLIGAQIVEEIRKAVFDETGFRCSAGIAHNKILAKLVCGLHKPDKQTVIPHESIPLMYKSLPLRKIRNLGGKFGETLSKDLNVTFMSELEQFSEQFLQQKFDERNGSWLFNIARGIDNEPVTLRLAPKSIGCCKRFLGVNAIRNTKDLKHWLHELALEVTERLGKDMDEYGRKATLMIVSYGLNIDKKQVSSTKSKQLNVYNDERMTNDAFDIVLRNNILVNDEFKYPVIFLGISASKFEDQNSKNSNIMAFFDKANKKLNSDHDKSEMDVKNEVETNKQSEVGHYENITGENKDELVDKLEESTKSLGIMSFFKKANSNLQTEEPQKFDEKENENQQTKLISETISNDETSVDKNNLKVENILTKPNNNVESTQTNQMARPSIESKPIDEYIQSNIEPKLNTNQSAINTPKSATKFERKPSLLEMLETIKQKRQINEPTTSKRKLNYEFNDDEVHSDDDLFDGEQSMVTISNGEVTKTAQPPDTFKCELCGESIKVSETTEHNDYHFALLAEENGSSLSITKTSTNNNTTKKSPNKENVPNQTTESSKVANTMNISNFFKVENSNDACGVLQSEICAECGKSVFLKDFWEHLDFHEAKRIQMELNGIQRRDSVGLVTTGGGKESSNKRKSDEIDGSCKKIKLLTEFFKPAT